MNILHLDTGREMRGGQYQVLLLMEALARRGHRQLLLAPADSPLLKTAKEGGLRAEASDWLIPQAGYDLLHAHDAGAHTRAALWSRRIPFVVSRRVAFPVGRGFLSRWKYGRAAHFAGVSDFVRRELVGAGVPERKVSVVHDGACLPDLSQAAELRAGFRREHGLEAEAFVAGSIGVAPGKPVKLLLAAAESRPRIKTLAMAPADPSPFLFALDALVYLSESEGLGSGILLAMAHGLPVIASDVGGIPEIVRHRQTGLLVRNSVPEIGSALEELLADGGLRQALGSAAREWVAANATDDIMAAKTEDVYRKVLASGN